MADTGTHAPVRELRSDTTERMSRAVDPDTPEPRKREPSALATLAGHAFDKVVLHEAVDSAARVKLRELFVELADSAATAGIEAYRAARHDADDDADEKPPSPRSAIPWAVALSSLFGLVFFAVAVLGYLVHDLRDRQSEAEQYQLELAQWLVVDHERSYEAIRGLDTMGRRLAAAVGAKVEDIDAPQETTPPDGLQRRYWRKKAEQ